MKIHGDSHKPLHNIWSGVKVRCKNRGSWNYQYYGAKGISVCAEWEEYLNFKKWALENGYSDGLSIDRIDVNGDYTPENCRWVPLSDQKRNTTRSRFIEALGQRKTIAEWARETGLSQRTIGRRLERGWTQEEAVSPTRFKGNGKYRKPCEEG